MDVNPVPTPRSPALGQTTAASARLPGVASSDVNQGSATRLAQSRAGISETSFGQAGGGHVEEGQSEDLQKAEALRALIGDKNMQLRTYHDEASGRSVLEVSDQATGQIITQYPSDELLRLYAALREPLFDRRA